MFLLSNLDREPRFSPHLNPGSNIGNAYSGGMREDLNMTSTQYSIALLVFFIGSCSLHGLWAAAEIVFRILPRRDTF